MSGIPVDLIIVVLKKKMRFMYKSLLVIKVHRGSGDQIGNDSSSLNYGVLMKPTKLKQRGVRTTLCSGST